MKTMEFKKMLALVMTIGEILLIAGMIWLWKTGVSTQDANVVNLINGLALAYHSGWMLVIGYYFASSEGSARKTEMMNGGPK